MLTFISFFVTRKCPKNPKKQSKKSMKIVNINGKKSSYFLNDLRNFNEIFRKDMDYDNIKSLITRVPPSL